MNAPDAVIIERRDGAVHVGGALTLTTARRALDATAGVFEKTGDDGLVFDLAGVNESDSAALAVLLEWMRRAGKQGRKLAYRNAPDRLRQLARISDLEAVLGLEG